MGKTFAPIEIRRRKCTLNAYALLIIILYFASHEIKMTELLIALTKTFTSNDAKVRGLVFLHL